MGLVFQLGVQLKATMNQSFLQQLGLGAFHTGVEAWDFNVPSIGIWWGFATNFLQLRVGILCGNLQVGFCRGKELRRLRVGVYNTAMSAYAVIVLE